MNALQRERVKLCVVHGSRDGHGRGSEILHLLGIHVMIPQILGHIYHIPDGAAGMTGHEIGQKVLLLSELFGNLLEPFPKGIQNLPGRFMHACRHAGRDMLGSDLQVAGDMVLAEIVQIVRGTGIGYYQIMPDP